MWKTRLRTDFHLAIIVLFGTITVLGVTPFAIYRFWNGQPIVGTVDMVIVLFIGVSTLYAWRTGRSAGAAIVASIAYSIGCIAVAHLAGLSGVLWVYPVLVANFLLVDRRLALTISALAILTIAASDAALASVLHKTMFVATSLVVGLWLLRPGFTRRRAA
jgi:diguanylate cyclase